MRKGLLLLIVVQAAAAGPAAAEPLGRWALDEGAGQTAADSTGTGHDGWLGEAVGVDRHDPTWVPGRFGSALRFDADRDLFVSIRNHATLAPARVTVESWVRRLGSPGRWRYVFSSGATQCLSAPYGMYSGFGGGLAFYVGSGGAYVVSPEAPAQQVWDGSWHHVAGTYDGQRVRLYLDGAEVAGGTPTTLSIGYGRAATGAFIGTYRGSCSRPFTGDIDEVAVHDRALTSQQIDAMAAKEAAKPLPPQAAPVAGAPASGSGGGGAPASGGGGGPAETTDSTRCLTLVVRPHRIVARRRTRMLVTVRRGTKRAAGRRVKVTGRGIARTVRTGPRGRARLVVRASSRGRLRLKTLGHPTRCPAKFVPVTRLIT